MPPDTESVSLPEPPPPRPIAREAAIDAAMRRFEGIADQPKPKSGGGWNRNPVWGLAMAASLVAVIGLPAAFIAIRDQGATPSSQSAPRKSVAQPRRGVVPSPAVPEAATEPSVVEPRAVAPPGVPPVRLQREEAKDSSVAEAPSAPAVDMAYAAPPPPPPPAPPPPAPPAAAEKVASTGDLVVTGSRIPKPNLSAQSGSMNRETSRVAAERDENDVANRLPASAAPTAPDWVLNDPSYRRFLTQLQDAVRGNDREAVVKLVSLPLRVNYSRSRLYRDTKSVRADYDRIFTPKVRKAILAQRFEQLFGRDQGVMIGSGQVWFDHICTNTACSPAGPVRITAINP